MLISTWRQDRSIARYDNASRGWCVRRSRSPKSSAITSELSGISFVIPTSLAVRHYLDSTTTLRDKASHPHGFRTQDTARLQTPQPLLIQVMTTAPLIPARDGSVAIGCGPQRPPGACLTGQSVRVELVLRQRGFEG